MVVFYLKIIYQILLYIMLNYCEKLCNYRGGLWGYKMNILGLKQVKSIPNSQCTNGHLWCDLRVHPGLEGNFREEKNKKMGLLYVSL